MKISKEGMWRVWKMPERTGQTAKKMRGHSKKAYWKMRKETNYRGGQQLSWDTWV